MPTPEPKNASGEAAQARPGDPCVFVIFGATGDLTKRLLMPALYNLLANKLLPDKFAIVGVSNVKMSSADFRKQLGDEIAQFAERHHALGAVAKRHALERVGTEAIEPAFAFGQPAEHIVVMHHGLAVGGELNIAFDGEIAFDGSKRCARHVFDDAARAIVQAAMGDRSRRQPFGRAHQEALSTRLRIPLRPRPRRPPAATRRRPWYGHGGPCRRKPRPSGRKRR